MRFTSDAATAVVAAYRAGATMTTAAGLAAVNRKTVQRWLKRGAQGEEPYRTFAESVADARKAHFDERCRNFRESVAA